MIILIATILAIFLLILVFQVLIHFSVISTRDIKPIFVTLLLIAYAIIDLWISENPASPFLAFALIIAVWSIRNDHDRQMEKQAELEEQLENLLKQDK